MTKKYYAVRQGKKIGIFTSWDDCKKNVNGYSGAEYKSFKSKIDAEKYMNDRKQYTVQKEKNIDEIIVKDKDRAIAYVDGSYKKKTKEFSYGAVIFWNNKEYHFSDKFDDEELSKMRNVSGELKGAEKAIAFGIDNKIKEIDIYHDYEGISKWATGDWKANKDGTKSYKKYCIDASKKIKINFVKVKGHSGDKYNDLADKLAKEALETKATGNLIQ